MIHVAYGLNDASGTYSKFTGTSILSMFENITNPPPCVTVHILHDNTLTQDSREKFIYLAGRYNQIIKFYNIEKLIPNLVEIIPKSMHNRILSPRFTIGTLYRLILDRIISKEVDKIIYLDSDIVINLDINELWQINLGDKFIAAVTLFDNCVEYKRNEPLQNILVCQNNLVKVEDYLNDGVMLINLKKFRNEGSILKWGENNIPEEKMQFADGSQQYFNICFSADSLKLPTKFNCFVYYARDAGVNEISRKIYHFVEGNVYRGLRLDTKDVFSRLFFKYFMMTPWFTEDTLGNIFGSLKQMYVERQNLMIKISAMLSGKYRTFVTTSQNADTLKKVFSIRDDEDILIIGEQEWLQNLIAAIKSSAGKKFFIIFAGGLYPLICSALMQVGFIEGRDFINGEIFLSEEHGVPLNLYSIIQKM